MASFEIRWKTSAKKELKTLTQPTILKILKVIESLAENPYPHGTKKLQGTEHTYRLRIGDYRIIYSVESSILLIEVIRIGHRKEVYKRIT